MGGLTFEEMNSWRFEISTALKNIALDLGCKLKVINPVDYYNFEEKKYQSQKEVEDFDLRHIVSSDIIIVNLDGLNSSDGTKYEMFEAYRHNIPVITFGDKELYNKLHPWVQSKITRVEPSVWHVCKYIRDFYMV